MKQAVICFPEVKLSGELLARQQAAEATLRKDVEAAMVLVNQPNQQPNSLGFTPREIARVQISEAKRWFHSGAFGRVSVRIK